MTNATNALSNLLVADTKLYTQPRIEAPDLEQYTDLEIAELRTTVAILHTKHVCGYLASPVRTLRNPIGRYYAGRTTPSDCGTFSTALDRNGEYFDNIGDAHARVRELGGDASLPVEVVA